MFQILIGVIFILLLLILSYTISLITKISILSKIKSKVLRFIISIMPIIIIFVIFNVVNSVVILLHFSIFVIITKLIFKLFKKNNNYDYILLCGTIITILFMSYAAYQDYHIYETKYEINTSKELGTDRFRILQISDSHVGTTFDGEGFYKIIKDISKIETDLFVITGDFVDDDTTKKDMIKSCESLSLLNPKYGKYFIYGNHDRGYFSDKKFTEEELLMELKKNNVTVLKDETIELNDYIYLIGREDKSHGRKSIKELTSSLDKSKYMIDLNHQPNDYENEKNEKIDLVLSGHTHGGQLFPLGYIGLLFNANDMFKGIKKVDNTTFVVNTGISDWAIDFKTGTKSEYVIIDVVKE